MIKLKKKKRNLVLSYLQEEMIKSFRMEKVALFCFVSFFVVCFVLFCFCRERNLSGILEFFAFPLEQGYTVSTIIFLDILPFSLADLVCT